MEQAASWLISRHWSQTDRKAGSLPYVRSRRRPGRPGSCSQYSHTPTQGSCAVDCTNRGHVGEADFRKQLVRLEQHRRFAVGVSPRPTSQPVMLVVVIPGGGGFCQRSKNPGRSSRRIKATSDPDFSSRIARRLAARWARADIKRQHQIRSPHQIPHIKVLIHAAGSHARCRLPTSTRRPCRRPARCTPDARARFRVVNIHLSTNPGCQQPAVRRKIQWPESVTILPSDQSNLPLAVQDRRHAEPLKRRPSRRAGKSRRHPPHREESPKTDCVALRNPKLSLLPFEAEPEPVL